MPALLAGDHGPYLLAVVFAINVAGEVGIPFPLVMQGLLLFSGLLISQGHVEYGLSLLGMSFLGSCTGAMVWYWSTRAIGRPLVSKVWSKVGLRKRWLEAGESKVATTGPWGIFLARLTPGLTIPVTIGSGLMKVSWHKFLLGVAMSEVAWLTPFSAVGFLAGRTGLNVTKWMKYFPWVFVLAVSSFLFFKLATLVLRRVSRRESTRAKAAWPR
ncbi:MAG: DedA family protein [Chloroflexi bacterium]|nr:DedA family protein [Chloroflexota bacterium]